MESPRNLAFYLMLFCIQRLATIIAGEVILHLLRFHNHSSSQNGRKGHQVIHLKTEFRRPASILLQLNLRCLTPHRNCCLGFRPNHHQ